MTHWYDRPITAAELAEIRKASPELADLFEELVREVAAISRDELERRKRKAAEHFRAQKVLFGLIERLRRPAS